MKKVTVRFLDEANMAFEAANYKMSFHSDVEFLNFVDERDNTVALIPSRQVKAVTFDAIVEDTDAS